MAWFFLILAVVVDPFYYLVPKDFRQDFIWHCSILAIVYSSLTLLRQEQIADPDIGEGAGSS